MFGTLVWNVFREKKKKIVIKSIESISSLSEKKKVFFKLVVSQKKKKLIHQWLKKIKKFFKSPSNQILTFNEWFDVWCLLVVFVMLPESNHLFFVSSNYGIFFFFLIDSDTFQEHNQSFSLNFCHRNCFLHQSFLVVYFFLKFRNFHSSQI